MKILSVPMDVACGRADKVLHTLLGELPYITRSQLAGFFGEGRVEVNGKVVQKSFSVKAGDVFSVKLPPLKDLDVLPENIPLDVVYEDEDLLIVNKPKGMVVHPAPGNWEHTLVNALMFHCRGTLSGINGVARPGIVHRIDKNTSGLLMVAKNDMSHLSLAEQISTHSFLRIYEAVVSGRMPHDSGRVDAPIGRHPVDRKKMCVTDKNSRNAVTDYRVLEEFYKKSMYYSHLQLKLHTGRTHQIRVHMAHLGHPVLGDDVYGKPFKGLEGQCLHAKTVGFIHPRSKKNLEFTSELPIYFKTLLESFRDKNSN